METNFMEKLLLIPDELINKAKELSEEWGQVAFIYYDEMGNRKVDVWSNYQHKSKLDIITIASYEVSNDPNNTPLEICDDRFYSNFDFIRVS